MAKGQDVKVVLFDLRRLWLKRRLQVFFHEHRTKILSSFEDWSLGMTPGPSLAGACERNLSRCYGGTPQAIVMMEAKSVMLSKLDTLS